MMIINGGAVQIFWVVMFCSMMIFVNVQGSHIVNITLIPSAVAKGAVCLDGSAPAYQFDKGHGTGANNWLVHIQALLSGCSAGGLSSILNRDKFRGFLPKSVNVKCVADAGYFLHKKDGNGGFNLAMKFARIIDLHGSAKNLPKSCTANTSLCFFPQYITPQIQTPLFIINSAFDQYQVRDLIATGQSNPGGSWFGCQFDINKCSPDQLKILQDFKTDFYLEVSKGLRSDTKSFRGIFINTCHAHCQSQVQDKWLGSPTSQIDNKSISAAVGDWFFERSAGNNSDAFKYMDNKHNLPHWCVFDPLEPNPKNNYTWPLGS